jgi:glutathione peroxidase
MGSSSSSGNVTSKPDAAKPDAAKPDGGGATGLEDPFNDTNCLASAAPGSFYALQANKLEDGMPAAMCSLKGKVTLVVNVASKCGYTPQYKPLQELQDKYLTQGFYVLGFPSNSFNQEFMNGKDISQFCRNEYGISFPMFEIGAVNGPAAQPVYQWLKGNTLGAPDIEWNFVKFVIDRKGKLAARFAQTVTPDAKQLTDVIEAELAKAP